MTNSNIVHIGNKELASNKSLLGLDRLVATKLGHTIKSEQKYDVRYLYISKHIYDTILAAYKADCGHMYRNSADLEISFKIQAPCVDASLAPDEVRVEDGFLV